MMKIKKDLGILICFSLIAYILTGCAGTPMQFNPNNTAPQLITDPPAIRLGIARLINDTPLVFQGRGFKPGDSVIINLVGVKKDKGPMDIPIAEAVVDGTGAFKTEEVTRLVKITELLQADTALNDQMETYIVISRPPIPAGEYTVRADSMDSDKKAECRLLIKDPSVLDSIKDWLGGLLGKIKKK